MLINQSNLSALFIAFSKQFADAYAGEPQPLLDKVGSKIASSTRDQRYPFVQAISGAMRQWTGARQLQNIVVDGFVVTNAKWENSLVIKREDIEDDQYGVYSDMLIPQLARHAKLLPDQQIASAINSGNSTLCFDGKNFFDTTHYIDPQAKTGSQSNSLSTLPLNATSLAKAQQTMMSWKGPDNIPLGSYGNVLLVPPSLKYVAETLAHATFYPEAKNNVAGVFGSQSNVWQGQFNVVTSEWLTDSGDPTTAVWYLLDCRAASMRPFFWQERTAPQLISMVDPANPFVFMQDEYVMGARARGAAAGSLWFKALRVSGA